MRNNKLSKKIIEGIVRNDNSSFVNAIDKQVEELIIDAINDLSSKISYVSTKNVVLQPANELLSGAMTDNSRFVYFLGVDNVQIDLNTRKSTVFWKALKERVVYAWRTRGSRRRAEKRLKKAAERQEKKEQEFNFDPSKYNLFNLTEDLQKAVSNYLSKTTLIYLEGNVLQIVGKEDFGSNTQIIIYITLYDGEKFKYFLGKKEGYLKIDFQKRVNSLNEKIDKVGEVFVNMIKIYNVLYFDVNGVMPNQIFVESLFYNCPDELFDADDPYKTFVKIINYFTVKSSRNFKSIVSEFNIFKDKLCGNSSFGHSKLLNNLNELSE